MNICSVIILQMTFFPHSEVSRRLTSSLAQSPIHASFPLFVSEPLLYAVSDSLTYVGFPYVWSFSLMTLSHVELIIRSAERTLKGEVSFLLRCALPHI